MAGRMEMLNLVISRLFSIGAEDNDRLERLFDLLNEDQREKLLALLVASSGLGFTGAPSSDPTSSGPSGNPFFGVAELPFFSEQELNPAEFANVIQAMQLESLNSGIGALSKEFKSLEDALTHRTMHQQFQQKQQFGQLMASSALATQYSTLTK
jgi:hypothetical protein